MKLPELQQISDDLERALVAALIRGVVPIDSVPKDALSKHAKEVYGGIDFLSQIGHKPPFSRTTVLTAAGDVVGADKDALRPYIADVLKEGGGKEVNGILQALVEEQALLGIVNEANRQLEKHEFTPSAFAPLLATKRAAGLVSAGELLVDGKLPPIPTGARISLPELQAASGGVFGIWVVGGKQKAGKSTLAVQLSLEVATTMPVIYYDMENGEQVLLYRIGRAFNDDVKKVKEATKQFYIRRNARTLDADLSSVPAPALIVIDSLQKLPTKLDQRRTGLDHWLGRLEALKQSGYTVMVVSEVNGMGNYKETSEIGYTADLAFQVENHGEYASLIVTENRHRPKTGHICDIERVNDWWFKEADDLSNAAEELGL